MPPSADRIELLAQAARPTLLDAAARPELLYSIILANLMSPKTWELAGRIRERMGPSPSTGAAMLAIHDFIDKRLRHSTAMEVASVWGLDDLSEERRRLGGEAVDYPISLIMAAMEFSKALGHEAGADELVNMAETGHFPEYEYATLDLSEAYPKSLKGHQSLGLVSCADVATLSASLACLLGPIPIQDIILLGSPHHYTTFVLHPSGGFWFSGKRDFFTPATWAAQAQVRGEQGIRDALDLHAAVLDRTIAWSGVHLYAQRRSSIPEQELARYYDAVRRFLIVEPPGLAVASQRPTACEPSSAPPPLDLAAMTNPEQVRQAIDSLAQSHPSSVCALAPYTARRLDVEAPEAYIRAGRRGLRVRQAAARVDSLASACAAARAIPRSQPLFGDIERIALPDEALVFGAAGHRERALLILCLLALAPAVPALDKQDLALLFTPQASFVRAGAKTVDAATGLEAPAPPGARVIPAAPALTGA
ncbi:MAG TPA: hypothetical protein P5137_13615 [Candidatus Brocadiia bacterium]|nr:hypothetical protein [Candidatus Brocadiia bacterium]